jgi:hypothetical protein
MAEPITYETWGVLKPDAPFAHLFEDGRVPLRSMWTMRPRDERAPLCYLVAGDQLTDGQVRGLAQDLYQMWVPECASVEEAAAYIREDLPLRADWFSSVGTARLGLINLP